MDTASYATSSAASSRRRDRRRRRLETTDSEAVEFSDFSGEFADAEEACESEGYVFGAPRTAYENALVRLKMEVRALSPPRGP